MAIKCGIVGLPNVGKSTLFNALTQAEIPAENYPFCTIDPNVGIVMVPDPRLDELSKIVKPQKTLPTTVEFVDIAGLVAGAAKGEGLGNKFLANVRETDAIAHVVRCFDNDDVIHVAGKVDPLDDIEVINTELALADLESVDKQLQKATKNAKSQDKEAIRLRDVLQKMSAHLGEGNPLRTLNLADNELDTIKNLQFITDKPVMFVANVNEDGFDNNPYLDRVREIATKENAVVVAVCAAMEAEIIQLDEDEQSEFLAEMGMTGYELLGLETYFTAGEKEVRAWTVRAGSTAPKAAAVIHTDFEKGFIRAEVVAYDDFIKYQGESGAKEAGRFRLEGKEYIVQEGDVMHFRFNV